MDDNPYHAPQADRNDRGGPPLVGAPLLTAFLLFIALPLLVVLVVLLNLLF